MGLYDLFARGMTGTIVLCAAHVFGMANLLNGGVPVWAIILGGYFCGLVLEELSFMLEKLTHSREKIEKKVCLDYPKYDYTQCKNALLANGQEIVADEPLAHIVMSESYKIAFIVFLLMEILDVVCFDNLVSDCFISPAWDMVTLIALILIFHYRANHYIKRRTESIFDYCITKEYENIG